MTSFDLRALTLGAQFKPRVEDIPTPDLFTAQGAPDDLLRLVALSATHRLELIGGFGSDEAVNSAILTIAVVRYRDAGGSDGNGTYVYGKLDENGVSVPNFADAPAMAAQDFDLVNMWAALVKPFMGIGKPIAAAVDDAKNGSQATASSAGGSESPTNSDSPPSEDASQP